MSHDLALGDKEERPKQHTRCDFQSASVFPLKSVYATGQKMLLFSTAQLD